MPAPKISRHFRFLLLALAILPLILSYMNCGGGAMSGLPPASNPLQIPDPTCGETGFKFLMDNYFVEHCASCHTKVGFEPRFADPQDFASSFLVTQGIMRSTLLKTVTQNTFCGSTGCNLDTADPLYKAIDQWTTMRYSCPDPFDGF